MRVLLYEVVILNIDSIILDTIKSFRNIYIKFFKTKNVHITKEYIENIQLLQLEELIKYTIDFFGFEESFDDILMQWNDITFLEYKNNVRLKGGIYEYLLYLKENNKKIAIITDCPASLYEVSLKKNKIYDFFDTIMQIDNQNNIKDIYNLCINSLGTSNKKCIAFENNINYIKQIKDIGVKVFSVYEHDIFKKNKILDICDDYITDFREMIL